MLSLASITSTIPDCPLCALFAGTTDTGAAAVLEAIEDAAPDVGLYGPAGLANGAFAESVNPDVARSLQITSPALPTRVLPPEAARFARTFRNEYGHDPDPAALFGYEAMRAVLAAMRAAGKRGNDREAVIHAYFALRDRRTALGTWSVSPTGDTTLRRFGAWRVAGGRLAFERELLSGGA
jgi:branched-chain amino acid transport system substrate-binding protein